MTTFNAKAETVIKDANIITIDPRHPRAQALAMGHGRFLAVGDNDDMKGLIGPGTQVMNLTGKTVLPGFIDAHIHVLSSGVKHVTNADCEQPSIAAVQNALRGQSRRYPRRGVGPGLQVRRHENAGAPVPHPAGPGRRQHRPSHLREPTGPATSTASTARAWS